MLLRRRGHAGSAPRRRSFPYAAHPPACPLPGAPRLFSMLHLGASLCVQALEEGFDQVVCIAAGYDTRAYRFHRPGVKVGVPHHVKWRGGGGQA